ncbi:hypothetical protein N9C31_01585 [Gammaproteobacteria bacterium]|nr:hypothetical protein [Gammaproteobacteria bacterium]
MNLILKNNPGQHQLLVFHRKGFLTFVIISLMAYLFFSTTQMYGFILSGLIYSAIERMGILIAFSANCLSEQDMLRKMILSRVIMLLLLILFFIFIFSSGNYNHFFVSLGLLMSVISHKAVFYKWQSYE